MAKNKKLTPSKSNVKNLDNKELIKVNPRNKEQEDLIEAIENSTYIFAIGPAGTGKSYISMKVAVKLLLEKKTSGLVLVRPAVPTESIGFLPGDKEAKFDPYHIPLRDIMSKHMRYADISKMFKDGHIEIEGIAFMRGRTFDNCIVIIDEAQNTTIKQMKMIMTRLGENCIMVFNGDTNQIDIREKDSGLLDAVNRFGDLNHREFSVVELKKIERNPLISIVLEQYNKGKENG